MTSIPGMSDITFEKLKLVAQLKRVTPLSAKWELNRYGLYCRVTNLKDGTLVLDAGGRLIRRLQVIIESGTWSIVQVRQFEPWSWDELVGKTYLHAIELIWQAFNQATRDLYETEKELAGKPESVKLLKIKEEIDGAWNGAKAFLLCDAAITGQFGSLIDKLADLERRLDEVDMVAPTLAGSFWLAKLQAAYGKGDATAARQLESNPPRIYLEEGPEAIAHAIEVIRAETEESLERLRVLRKETE